GIRDGHVTGVQTCALPILGAILHLPCTRAAVYAPRFPEGDVEMRIWHGFSVVLAVVAIAVACGKGSGPNGSNPDGGATVKDISYIRESRGILTTEPIGLRNLEVLVGGTRTQITKATTVDASVCQIGCVLSPD